MKTAGNSLLIAASVLFLTISVALWAEIKLPTQFYLFGMIAFSIGMVLRSFNKKPASNRNVQDPPSRTGKREGMFAIRALCLMFVMFLCIATGREIGQPRPGAEELSANATINERVVAPASAGGAPPPSPHDLKSKPTLALVVYFSVRKQTDESIEAMRLAACSDNPSVARAAQVCLIKWGK